MYYVLRTVTMNRLPEGLKAGLSGIALEELQTVFADLAEEAQVKQQAMEMTMEKLMEDIQALEASRQTNKQEWQREREKLIAAAEAARQAEREKIDSNLSQMASQLKNIVEKKDKEREIYFALEKEKRKMLFLLEQKEEEDYKKMMTIDKELAMKDAANWGRLAREKENGTLCMVLRTAALKQRLLIELREHADKWMVVNFTTDCISPCLVGDLMRIIYAMCRNTVIMWCLFFPPQAPGTSTKERSAEKTPVVFTTWMVREEWRKLQANKLSLNDGLQVPGHTLLLSQN